MKTQPLSLFFGGMITVLLMGCSYTNQFRDAGAIGPHAVLTAEDVTHWRDRGPTITHINEQPTTFWCSSERFNVALGPTMIRVVADQEPYDYAPIKFTPVAGHHYEVRYLDDRSSVGLFDLPISGAPILLASSRRERASH